MTNPINLSRRAAKYTCKIHVRCQIFFLICQAKNLLGMSYMYDVMRGGGLGSRPKKMYGERLGDGVEYHFMKPTPRREVPFTTGRRFHEIS